MFSTECVRVYLRLCVQNISQSCERIWVKFCTQVERGPERNQLDFGGDPGSFMDPGSFSRILYH